MSNQIAGSCEENFMDQLDVNFDYFISKEFQMFKASLKGSAGTWTDSIPSHVLQGSLNIRYI